MKSSTLLLPIVIALAAGAPAAVITVTNGDFESGTNPDATGWDRIDGIGTNSSPSNYAEVIPGISGRTMQIKSDGENHIQQTLTISDLGPLDATSFNNFTVTLDYGYRRDAVTNGDHTLRISLWNLTDDAELAGSDLFIANPGVGANSLVSTSVDLGYDSSALSLVGDAIAFRIASISGDLGSSSWSRTAVIDNVAITAVPEPAAAVLGSLGLLALFVRRRD